MTPPLTVVSVATYLGTRALGLLFLYYFIVGCLDDVARLWTVVAAVFGARVA